MSNLKVIFNLSKKIAKGLKSGEYLRKGGVIVDKNHKIVTWLKDASVHVMNGENIKKVLKLKDVIDITNIGFNMINTYVMNNELKTISGEMIQIKENQRAQMFSLIESGNKLIQESELIQNQQNRDNQLLSAREKYVDVITIFKKKNEYLLKRAAKKEKKFFKIFEIDKIPSKVVDIFSFMFSQIIQPAGSLKGNRNKTHLNIMYNLYDECLGYLEWIYLAYLGVSKTYYLQNEKVAAIKQFGDLKLYLNNIIKEIEKRVNIDYLEKIKEKFKKITVRLGVIDVANTVETGKLSEGMSYIPLSNINDVENNYERISTKLFKLQVKKELIDSYQEEIEFIPYVIPENI